MVSDPCTISIDNNQHSTEKLFNGNFYVDLKPGWSQPTRCDGLRRGFGIALHRHFSRRWNGSGVMEERLEKKLFGSKRRKLLLNEDQKHAPLRLT